MRRRNLRQAALPVLGLLTAITLTACSGGGDDGAAAAGADGGSGSGGSGSASTGDPMLDFVQCLRDNGIDVADPGADGSINLGADPNDPAIQAALDNCRSILEEGGGGGVTMGDGPGGMASQESLLAFVDCMRDNGFDMPDPGSDGMLMLPENFDPTDGAFQAAGQECAPLLDGGLRVGGGSGEGGMSVQGG